MATLRYSLDSSLLVGYFSQEFKSETLLSISNESALPFITLTEFYSVATKRYGKDFAEKSLISVQAWKMPILFPQHSTLLLSGELIAIHKLGIADSFIAALSIENDLMLVTKDNDFRKLGDILKIKLIR